MTNDSGRSPSGRAGHEPNPQAVSAVPVTIPIAEDYPAKARVCTGDRELSEHINEAYDNWCLASRRGEFARTHPGDAFEAGYRAALQDRAAVKLTPEQARSLFLDHCSVGPNSVLERYGVDAAVAAILEASSS